MNWKSVVFVAGLTVLVGVLAYSSGKNGVQNAQSLSATAVSSVPVADHHGGSPQNYTYADLNSLIGKTPSFSLANREDEIYSSENLRGKNVVLFFNEGLMCYPACWSQIAAFPKDVRLNSADTVVLSVVVDSPKDWRTAIEKMPELAAATVVFDVQKTASAEFGVLKSESSMHYGSLPGHTYVVLDKNGVVRHVFDDPNMAIHNAQLVETIAGLN